MDDNKSESSTISRGDRSRRLPRLCFNRSSKGGSKAGDRDEDDMLALGDKKSMSPGSINSSAVE